MRQITYNGERMITGTEVADAVVRYVTHVAAMAAAVAVGVPVLEANGTVQAHTLILSASTQLEVVDVDGIVGQDEGVRFSVPEFPPVGGQAYPVAPEAIASDAPFLDEDLMGLAQG